MSQTCCLSSHAITSSCWRRFARCDGAYSGNGESHWPALPCYWLWACSRRCRRPSTWQDVHAGTSHHFREQRCLPILHASQRRRQPGDKQELHLGPPRVLFLKCSRAAETSAGTCCWATDEALAPRSARGPRLAAAWEAAGHRRLRLNASVAAGRLGHLGAVPARAAPRSAQGTGSRSSITCLGPARRAP